jgi:F-type H+-transporting ATPase subunit b
MDISTFLPQIFWLVITFTLLYVVMARSALPKVGRVLEERQNRIDSDLEQAETFRTESEKLEADYERLTAEARAKALAHLKAEREKVEAVLSEKQSVMAAQLEARLAEAEARIQKAKDKAYTGVADIAAEACASIVAEVSGQTLTKANAKKAVGSAMGDK